MRITTDDGVGLEVSVAGEGAALFLVHGFGGAKEDFADHVDALAATGHRVVSFDHRGHGESDQPTELAAYSLDRLVSDVVQVADALGIERFRLLGHSMGGMVARRIALRHRERVEALVLMDTSPGPVPGLDRELMELGAQIALAEGKDVLKAVLDETKPLETPAYLRLLDERPGYREFVEYKWRALSVRMWAALVREIANQTDDLEALGSLDLPVLVVVGELDEQFLAPSAALHAAIPGSRLAVVPDAGHSPQAEAPDAWFAAIDGFLSSLAAPVGDPA